MLKKGEMILMHDIITISAESGIRCKSLYFTCGVFIDETIMIHSGLNKFTGEIDSAGWGISCLLSVEKSLVASDAVTIAVNNEAVALEALREKCCYMDESNPLFSSKSTLRKLILKAIKTHKSSYSLENVMAMFNLSEERLDRRIANMGNERFRGMAALGFLHNKEIFCFPWMSEKLLKTFQWTLKYTFEPLLKFDKTIIFPSGKPIASYEALSALKANEVKCD